MLEAAEQWLQLREQVYGEQLQNAVASLRRKLNMNTQMQSGLVRPCRKMACKVTKQGTGAQPAEVKRLQRRVPCHMTTVVDPGAEVS